MNIEPGSLTLSQLRRVRGGVDSLQLPEKAWERIRSSAETVTGIAQASAPAYGINTGFGRLANTQIPPSELELLQRNLVLSHAVGVGDPLPDTVVRMVLLLKIASLAQGYSGVSVELMEMLIALLIHDILPVIPSQGSVGASGDLAPLAHLATALIGVGEVRLHGQKLAALECLTGLGLGPLVLRPKEGLALLNGTQVSTALALEGLFAIDNATRAAVVTGALSVDAAAGSVVPFDARIQEVRGHAGQKIAAQAYLTLLAGSGITQWHQDCEKVQDPYSLRCQPQVMGSSFEVLQWSAARLLVEANGVSDNPLVFSETDEVLSGGNFHAEPVAMACDFLAIAASEVGGLAERRIALLIDATLSGLPPFLVRNGGVNSGFMIAHVTAASLASENKSLAHPASVDSLPTSANQEDHVSMATFAARRLTPLARNVATIVGIELLAAVQGIELRSPVKTSPTLLEVIARLRQVVPHYDVDHFMAPDIQAALGLVEDGTIGQFCPIEVITQ
ncbi:histidine ammonia-lyase [Ferrimicrobium sp.]|uniref:histidine ammonia-lyase n=1 Tax=Ferrimicrobium sp. TaxID=2926050 RepID=UPI002611D5C8|nr:histidine ammonia-lyase [Ferrimicrobium sp.]